MAPPLRRPAARPPRRLASAARVAARAVRGADVRRGGHRRRRRIRARRRSIRSNIPTIAAVKPYTPLEIEGRDLYIREGCVGCHSQMIRPLRAETARYGDYSKAGEFVYDHPFLWGSKRTGPDLQREGGKYPGRVALRAHAPAVARPRRARSCRRTRGSTTRRWIPRTSRARSSPCAGSACRIRMDTNAAPRPN